MNRFFSGFYTDFAFCSFPVITFFVFLRFTIRFLVFVGYFFYNFKACCWISTWDKNITFNTV